MFKPLAPKQMSHADLLRAINKNAGIINRAFKKAENNINLAFLDINEYPLHLTQLLINQIIVMYRNGRFETLPIGINGPAIKDFLGIRYPRITHWSAMPACGSRHHFARFPSDKAHYPKDKDIYEC